MKRPEQGSGPQEVCSYVFHIDWSVIPVVVSPRRRSARDASVAPGCLSDRFTGSSTGAAGPQRFGRRTGSGSGRDEDDGGGGGDDGWLLTRGSALSWRRQRRGHRSQPPLLAWSCSIARVWIRVSSMHARSEKDAMRGGTEERERSDSGRRNTHSCQEPQKHSGSIQPHQPERRRAHAHKHLLDSATPLHLANRVLLTRFESIRQLTPQLGCGC